MYTQTENKKYLDVVNLTQLPLKATLYRQVFLLHQYLHLQASTINRTASINVSNLERKLEMGDLQ